MAPLNDRADPLIKYINLIYDTTNHTRGQASISIARQPDLTDEAFVVWY